MHNSMLADLGWSAFFLAQLELSEIGQCQPARVAGVHRTRLAVLGEAGPQSVTLPGHGSTAGVAVGDWLLVGPQGQMLRRLERRSLVQRRAAGTGVEAQLIAANVDTLFITSSCNADFNPARLERYLALAAEAGAEPVVILTKADLATDPATFRQRAEAVARGRVVLAVDAHDPVLLVQLADWCRKGQTVALLGSSGVGKSTLMNTLAGFAAGTGADTGPIRDGDAKGRHTTTARALHPCLGGGWIIDTPGMREVRLTDAAVGIDVLFADIVELAPLCRFRDCSHASEPGCAVQAEISAGRLEPGRLARWRKLRREDQSNSQTVAKARSPSRASGRFRKAES